MSGAFLRRYIFPGVSHYVDLPGLERAVQRAGMQRARARGGHALLRVHGARLGAPARGVPRGARRAPRRGRGARVPALPLGLAPLPAATSRTQAYHLVAALSDAAQRRAPLGRRELPRGVRGARARRGLDPDLPARSDRREVQRALHRRQHRRLGLLRGALLDRPLDRAHRAAASAGTCADRCAGSSRCSHSRSCRSRCPAAGSRDCARTWPPVRGSDSWSRDSRACSRGRSHA